MLSIFEPQTRQGIIDWHSHSQKIKFGIWKKVLKDYEHGCRSLLSKLLATIEKDNFLEMLAEFNIAKHLRSRDIEFHYERPGHEDFLLDDVEISVKSIMPKKYEREELATMRQLVEASKKSGSKKEEFVTYRTSHTTLTARPDGSTERFEIGRGQGGLSSDFFQKSAIIKHINKFDKHQTEKAKVLFFVVQTDDCPTILFEEIINYYFLGQMIAEYDQFPYASIFSPFLHRDIGCFVFFYRPNEVLCWSPGCFSDTQRDMKGNTAKRYNRIGDKKVCEKVDDFFLPNA
jgi:hypothetical protein